jgi:hypothetical protein
MSRSASIPMKGCPMRAARFFAAAAVLAGACVAGGCGLDSGGGYKPYQELEAAANGHDSGDAASTEAKSPSAEAFVADATGDGADEPAVAPIPATPAGDAASTAETAANTSAANNGGSPSTTDAAAPAPPRQPRVLIPEKSFATEGPEEAVRVSYDDIDLLKVLNAEPVTEEALQLMPSWLKGLDGRRIRIRGFMYPPPIEDGIQAFALARDNQICCFGKNPKVYDLFPVYLREGVTTRYIFNRPFDVVGVFHIKVVADAGTVEQIYEIDDAVVIDR